jgi:membrane-associated HD superfamily phosphohydrolase
MQIDIADFTRSVKENDGYRYCFVAVDVFTKFCHEIPNRDKKPNESLRAMTEVLNTIGVMKQIYNDNEGSWNNTEFIRLLNKHDIKILQLCGQNDQKILNSYTVTGETFGQRAFLIKNSLAYVGSNNFSIQVASYFNNRIVAMYSNHYASQFNPYWSDKSRTTILEILENDKPSFSNTENPKVINNLMPDQIAQAIFDKLAIKVQTGLKFSHIGQNYISKTIEIVPNLIVDPASLGAPHIIVRMDIEFNEQILEAQLKTSKALIVTNKEISEDLVKKLRELNIRFVLDIVLFE